MNKAIKLIEKLGEGFDLSLLDKEAVPAELLEAIEAKDLATVEKMLDLVPDIVCILVPAEDDEPNKENDDDSKEGEEKSA